MGANQIMRNSFIRWSNVAKRSRLLDTVARYNPIYYRRIRTLINRSRGMDPTARNALVGRLLHRTLAWARRTQYGSSYGDRYDDWPLLEKQALRASLDSFCFTRMVAIPAATGGTTGVPIKLWRSLQCIAAEQAFIDDLLRNFGRHQ